MLHKIELDRMLSILVNLITGIIDSNDDDSFKMVTLLRNIRMSWKWSKIQGGWYSPDRKQLWTLVGLKYKCVDVLSGQIDKCILD